MRADGADAVHEQVPQAPACECPRPDELSAFSRGALPLASFKSIAEHVSACAQCDSRVSTLVSELGHKLTRSARSPALDDVIMPVKVEVEAACVDIPEINQAPTAPLRLGQYRLLRQIGRGGMGVVYQALHERLLREVAIKFVPIDKLDDLLDVERLKREMAAAGNVRHPNVVYATDAGEAEGIHYLVMEYVEGIDLAKLIGRVGPLAVADACEIIRQSAAGLEHIESQGLVHRDLKPSNLMLAADGTVKILDLGLARWKLAGANVQELTEDKYVLGTVDYVAPEQARDARQVDIRSDIYSLGCTLFRLLTGTPPFGGKQHSSVASKVLAHQQQPPPRLSGFRADVPAELQAIVDKMLAKNPARRQQSPQELRRELAPFCSSANLRTLLQQTDVALAAPAENESTVTVSTPPVATAPFPKRLSRRSLLIGVGALGAAAAGGIGLSRFGPWRPIRASEITKETHQINYPAAVGETQVIYRREIDGIQLESDDPQLIRLGTLADRKGRFAVTIDQHASQWVGDFGIFFGYRLVSGLSDVLSPRFQLLWFYHTGIDPKTNMPRKGMVLSREQAYIGPRMPNPWPTLVTLKRPAEAQFANPPPGTRLELEIMLEPAGFKTVRINGQVLEDLASDKTNAMFHPHDEFDGWMGLYNHGFHHTRFSNFDFSALERV